MNSLKIFLYILLFSICFVSSRGQTVIDKAFPAEGNIELTHDITIPKISAGYTLWLPESPPIGMIVFTHSRRDTLASDSLIDYALSNDLAVIYATTENLLEFLFSIEKMKEIEAYLMEAISNYQIPNDKLLFCGMSLEGTRALKMAIFAHTEASTYHLRPAAIVICDAPLDMIRFHKSMKKAEHLQAHPATANEGKWVSGYLEKNLEGNPTTKMKKYLAYSPYSYQEGGDRYLNYFGDIPIKAYTEPDIQWWMETRKKDYYDMNAIDLAAFINQLNVLGNGRAELITTTNRGYHPDGARHPHSWSIVDEREMVNWFVSIITRSKGE